MHKNYSDYYIYSDYDYNSKEYKPITKPNLDDSNNHIEVGIATDRFITLEINDSSIIELENLSKIFYNPSYKFILEKKLGSRIKELNKKYFNSEHFDFLLFLILNAQKHYLDLLAEDSSFGLENDLKTLNLQKRKLIKVLEMFSNRYRLHKPGEPLILKISFNFLGKKGISIDNFIIIEDMLSTYLDKYEFNYSDPDKWKKEIDKYLISLDVEKLKNKFKIDLSKAIYTYLSEKGIIENNDSILNVGLRIINIVFSLASIPINKQTFFYKKKLSFKMYHSVKQMDVLRKWIKRS